MEFTYSTEESRQKEKEEILKNLTDDQKTEIVFEGEILYFIGTGHGYFEGFYYSYITKTGVYATQYLEGYWTIGSNDYNYVEGEFVLIPKEEYVPSKVDFSKIKMPIMKISARTIADDITPVAPITQKSYFSHAKRKPRRR